MDTLGLVECKSIAAGNACLDKMLKASEVELLRAGTICPGKFIIYITGDRESVRTSVEKACEGDIKLSASAVISNISKEIIQVLSRKALPKIDSVNAIGVIETSNVTNCIEMADMVIKTVDVELTRLNIAQSIAGKAYFVICGDLASINRAITLVKEVPENKVVDAVAIARPEPAVIKNLLGEV